MCGGNLMDDHKHTYDIASLAIAGGTVIGWLPSIAAALSIIWTLMRMYESRIFPRAAARVCRWWAGFGDKH